MFVTVKDASASHPTARSFAAARPATRGVGAWLSKTKIRAQKGHLTRRSKRALAHSALIERLRNKGTEADAGLTIDTTGMSDEEFIALLRR